MKDSHRVEAVSDANRGEVDEYLASHEHSAQFLINNLRVHGSQLTSHRNSGNFKAIRMDGRISAVFCLIRRGNLLVQADQDFSAAILSACAAESIPLKSFIGDWASVWPVWDRFKKANPRYKARFESKEILYTYALRPEDLRLVCDGRVRLLKSSDFDQWLELNACYLSELGVPDDVTDEQKRETFTQMTRDRLWWGLFSGNQLLSRAGLNSAGIAIGQVGGVFTPAPYRRKGYARATLWHMLKDCRDLHGHKKSVLFTSEGDTPAQKLYESMGYMRSGFFSIILG